MRARYIVICINPAFTQMIDGTEKPKISSKFAIRTARYNEFQCELISSRYNSEVRTFKYLLKVL